MIGAAFVLPALYLTVMFNHDTPEGISSTAHGGLSAPRAVGLDRLATPFEPLVQECTTLNAMKVAKQFARSQIGRWVRSSDPVGLACVYPLGYSARSVRANEGGRGDVHSAHGVQRGTDSANQCRAGAPCRGFVVRRSLVDHGGAGCTGDRDKCTEGWSWVPLSWLSWTVLRARSLAEVSREHRISPCLVSMKPILWPRIRALGYLEVPTPLSPVSFQPKRATPSLRLGSVSAASLGSTTSRSREEDRDHASGSFGW